MSGVSARPFDGVHWAPEIEWAFADRHALEFEIPMLDDEVEALKLAVQGTFREQRPRFIHGWQAVVEGALAGAGELTAIYIAGRRLGARVSALGMVGARARVSAERVTAGLVMNPSFFVDLGERVTIGVENIALVQGRDTQFSALPQLHLQLGRHLRVQVGAGVSVSAGAARPTFSARVVLE